MGSPKDIFTCHLSKCYRYNVLISCAISSDDIVAQCHQASGPDLLRIGQGKLTTGIINNKDGNFFVVFFKLGNK